MAPTLTLKKPELAIAKLSEDWVAAKVIAKNSAPQPVPTPKKAAPKERSHRTNVNPRLAWLCKKYPNVFGQRLPLKIGIYHDLVAVNPDVSKRSLRSALHCHSNHGAYLKLLVEGAYRIGLDGVDLRVDG
jgi:hypothetical protein